MEPTVFYIMRHGLTQWNARKRIQGRDDSPLTPEGERWAASWGERLAGRAIDRIVASPLGRAVATAEAVNRSLGLPLDTDERLAEQDWGRWTGAVLPEVARNHAEAFAEGWDFTPPGGESRRDMLARSLDVLDGLARSHPGRTLLLVTHEGVLKSLVYHLMGRAFLPSEPKVLETRLLCTVIHNGAPDLKALNEEP